MKRNVIALLSGLLFGIGLLLSGMTDPGKVTGFLDVFGSWDPSLALVMGGAVMAAAWPFHRARQRTRSWSGDAMSLPTSTSLDTRLFMGAAVFGIGWGLAGLCPGPAIVMAGTGVDGALAFVAAMGVGMWLQGRFPGPGPASR